MAEAEAFPVCGKNIMQTTRCVGARKRRPGTIYSCCRILVVAATGFTLFYVNQNIATSLALVRVVSLRQRRPVCHTLRGGAIANHSSLRFGKNTNTNNEDDDDDDGGGGGDSADKYNKYDSNDNNILDMDAFQRRKRKIVLQSFQQRWHQPPNPLLEDPIEFVEALLMSLQQPHGTSTGSSSNNNNNAFSSSSSSSNGALCLLRSSTPSWRKLLLNSVGAPPDATDDQVAPTLQSALERPNNQFAILMKPLEGSDACSSSSNKNNNSDGGGFGMATMRTVQNSWHFPSDPVIFQGDDDDDDDDNSDDDDNKVILDHCWIESRLRSPEDDQLLVVVGWSLQKQHLGDTNNDKANGFSASSASSLSPCWLLDGIDWQDFRDDFRPGIGREEWERICG